MISKYPKITTALALFTVLVAGLAAGRYSTREPFRAGPDSRSASIATVLPRSPAGQDHAPQGDNAKWVDVAVAGSSGEPVPPGPGPASGKRYCDCAETGVCNCVGGCDCRVPAGPGNVASMDDCTNGNCTQAPWTPTPRPIPRPQAGPSSSCTNSSCGVQGADGLRRGEASESTGRGKILPLLPNRPHILKRLLRKGARCANAGVQGFRRLCGRQQGIEVMAGCPEQAPAELPRPLAGDQQRENWI